MASLTVKGGPMTKTQQNVVNAMLAEARTQHASTLVMQALMFAAIMESDLGTVLGPNGGGYGGPLAGQMSYFKKFGSVSSLTVLQQQVDSFVGGGHGFSSATALEGQFQNRPGLLAAKVEEPVLSDGTLGPSGYGQYYSQNVNGLSGSALMNKVVGEAVLIVQQGGGGGVTGSTSGVSSGTKSSQKAPFYVGGPANPSEDVWTAINRLSQARYWYLFSDGETLYLADGATIMQQEPAYTIDRWGNLDKIVRLSFTWDNTAFQYASDHRKRRKIVRKTQMAKVTSPVEAELDLICPIDAVRAGDVIMLTGCGPGDGKWLVGDCRRSIFKIYSELTLVPAVKALSEAQAAGAGLSATSNADVPGAAAGAPGTGTIISALDSAAASINSKGWPFVSYGGRAQAGTPDPGHPGEPGGFYDGHTSGFDGPGALAAVLAAAGLWTGAVPDASAIISKLLKEKLLVRGRGNGVPEFSMFLGKFFFCFINATGKGSYWGSQDGGGPSNQAPPNIVAGHPSGGQFGGIWLNAPPSLSGYQEYHIPQNILGDLLNNAALGTLTGTYQNPFSAAAGSSLTIHRIDMGVDYSMPDGTPIHAIGDATIGQTFSLGTGGAGWPGNGKTDGGWVDYKLTDGPYQGKQIYVAEGVVPVVAAHSTVQAGQHIATFRTNNSNLETGWYGGVGTSTLAANLKQFNGANSTAAGVSFSRFMVSLGAPGGIDNGGNKMGSPLPAGYPGGPWGK